jgi:hypothetical protein
MIWGKSRTTWLGLSTCVLQDENERAHKSASMAMNIFFIKTGDKKLRRVKLIKKEKNKLGI